MHIHPLTFFWLMFGSWHRFFKNAGHFWHGGGWGAGVGPFLFRYMERHQVVRLNFMPPSRPLRKRVNGDSQSVGSTPRFVGGFLDARNKRVHWKKQVLMWKVLANHWRPRAFSMLMIKHRTHGGKLFVKAVRMFARKRVWWSWIVENTSLEAWTQESEEKCQALWHFGCIWITMDNQCTNKYISNIPLVSMELYIHPPADWLTIAYVWHIIAWLECDSCHNMFPSHVTGELCPHFIPFPITFARLRNEDLELKLNEVHNSAAEQITLFQAVKLDQHVNRRWWVTYVDPHRPILHVWVEHLNDESVAPDHLKP